MQRYVFSLVVLLLLIETYSLLPSRKKTEPAQTSTPFRTGIVHVHSRYSDGGGTIEEIAEAAREAGVDFVVITDHATSKARADGFERNFGGVDVYVEMEATTPAGHALVFYSHTSARELDDAEVNKLAWQHFLGEKSRDGMFLAIAHPSNIRTPWNRLDRFAEGIEVLNLDSMWQREVFEGVLDFSLSVALSPFNSFLGALRFFQVYPKDFLAWDAMNAVSPGHFALLGQDVHAKLSLGAKYSLAWPSYLDVFKLASNVLFIKDPPASEFEERKKQSYAALREGRGAMVFQAVYPFAGNEWSFTCGEKSYYSGETASLKSEGCEFVVQIPSTFPYANVARLYKDGDVFREVSVQGGIARIPVDAPGAYRLEVWAKPHTLLHILLGREVPYVIYNPIYIK